MSKYVMALNPYTALEKIYKRHGKDAGSVKLYRVLFMVWRYDFECLGVLKNGERQNG